MPRPPTGFLAGVAAAGLLARLVFGLGYWVHKPLTRDESEYLSLARSVAAGQGFVYDARVGSGPVEPFGRAPGYPAWLAAVGAGTPATDAVPAGVKIAQSLAGAAGVFLMGLLAWRLAGDAAARIAAVLAAVYPSLVWMSAYALSEAVFWPLALFAAWMFDRALDASPPRRLPLSAVAGALAGACVLVRPATSVALIIGAGWLAWKRRPQLLVAMALGAVIVIGPWSIRNVRHYGRFVLVASEGGVTFWTGNHPLATGEGDLAANPQLKMASQALRREHPDLSEESMEPVYYREAFRWMAGHPLSWMALEARKVWFLIVPLGPSYRVHSSRYIWASVLPYMAALPLAALGWWRLRGRLGRIAGFWIFVASVVVVCLAFFPQERFRFPMIDSALVLLSAAALARRSQAPS